MRTSSGDIRYTRTPPDCVTTSRTVATAAQLGFSQPGPHATKQLILAPGSGTGRKGGRRRATDSTRVEFERRISCVHRIRRDGGGCAVKARRASPVVRRLPLRNVYTKHSARAGCTRAVSRQGAGVRRPRNAHAPSASLGSCRHGDTRAFFSFCYLYGH